MSEQTMEQRELEQIGEYVRSNLTRWLKEGEAGHGAAVLSPLSIYTLSERMVRVEEGLKHQGETLERLITRMDQRFEEFQQNMDRRFEQVDKRFEESRENMDRRFEQMDKRFDESNRRFTIFSTILGLLVVTIPILISLVGLG